MIGEQSSKPALVGPWNSYTVLGACFDADAAAHVIQGNGMP